MERMELTGLLDGGGTGAAIAYEPATKIVGSGGKGTSYSGGTGSGGATNGACTSGSGSNLGGAGGNAGFYMQSGTSKAIAGGGTGNPTGISKSSLTIVNYGGLKNGTGGLLILYANNVINNGEISSRGVNSNTLRMIDIDRTIVGAYNAPGGASGGGSVNIFYKNNCLNGTINVNGGSTASGYGWTYGSVTSGAGGTGSISVGCIESGTYESTYTNY